MKIISKDREFKFKIYRFDNNVYQIIIETDDGREIMGEISFKIKEDLTWIYSISTEEKFQHMGVGQALLNMCELSSAIKGVNKIEALYVPSNNYAFPFYEKNKFEFIQREFDIIITKEIDIKKVKEKMKHKLIENDNALEL